MIFYTLEIVMLLQNGDVPLESLEIVDLPIKNCVVPLEMVDLPIKKCYFPLEMVDLPIKNDDFP